MPLCLRSCQRMCRRAGGGPQGYAEGAPATLALASLAPLAGLLVTLALLRAGGPPFALGGLAALAWVAVAPALSPDAVAPPLLLLGLSAVGLDDAEPPQPR